MRPPKRWANARVFMADKPGDTTKMVKNKRPLTILDSLLKSMDDVLQHCLPECHGAQAGSRKHCSTIQNLIGLRLLVGMSETA
eukprot:gene6840-biopygen5637